MKASDKISSRRAPAAAPAAKSADSFSSTAKRFSLGGPSLALDPSHHAYRKDIADIALAGQLIAPHYARPAMRRVAAPAVLHRSPRTEAETVGTLDPGEEFAVLEIAGGWAWGYRRRDHLVGYVDAGALGGPAAE